MSIRFPSLEFFETLQRHMASDPESTKGVEPSEAYCGFAIGDRLFVVEFDGRECAAVVSGGNTLDLDFFLSGSPEAWREAISGIRGPEGANAEHTLRALIDRGSIEICSEADGGEGMGRAAVDFLQAFLDQTKHVDVEFA